MTVKRNAIDLRTFGVLRESVGGDQEFPAELIDEFVEDAPKQLRSLREAATSGAAEVARRAAHTLKGNGRTFQLASLCQDAEAAAGAGDLDAVIARVNEIDARWDRARLELVAFRDGARDSA